MSSWRNLFPFDRRRKKKRGYPTLESKNAPQAAPIARPAIIRVSLAAPKAPFPRSVSAPLYGG